MPPASGWSRSSTRRRILLTALGAEADRVLGLEIGADDYVTKPFSPRELVLRIRSVLRRAGTAPAAGAGTPVDGNLLVDGNLVAATAAHEVRLDGTPIALTGREYDLLVFLLQHPRQAFSREELLSAVWGWSFGDLATVTVHVRRLRAKIEPDPALPTRLVTVRGVGYRYQPHQDPT